MERVKGVTRTVDDGPALPRGQAVRADYRLEESDDPRCGARGPSTCRGRRSRGCCGSAARRCRWLPRGLGRRSRSLRQRAARMVTPGRFLLRRAGRAQLDQALAGLAGVARVSAASRCSGAGASPAPARRPGHAEELLRDALGSRAGRLPSGGAGGRAAPRAGARRRGAGGRPRSSARTPARRPRGARAPLPRQELPRPVGAARGGLRRRARRRCRARGPRAGARGAAGLQRGGRRRRAVRGRHERGRRPGALRGGFGAAVSLDLGRMDRLLGVDERSLTAVFEPGIRLPEADRALAAHGLTLAHVPQSYEWATVGGCVATRSAGQTSTGHGRIDENVVAVRCATPLGDLARSTRPATRRRTVAARPRRGSEGALGVITRCRCGCIRCPQCSASRAGSSGCSRPAATPCDSSSSAAGARRRAAVRRGRDARLARPGRAGGLPRRCRRAAARRSRLPARARLGGRRKRRPPARAPRRCCAARARRRSARGRAARGPPRASPARTCATTCSTAA